MPTAGGACHGDYPDLHAGGFGDKYCAPLGEFSKYRFALVMEHIAREFYITEKILGSFLAGTVPVYYGAPEVFDIFNPEAFIFYNISDPEPALHRIAFLEKNPAEYAKVLAQPPLRHGQRTLEKYFSWSDDVGGGALKKQFREMLQVALGRNRYNSLRREPFIDTSEIDTAAADKEAAEFGTCAGP